MIDEWSAKTGAPKGTATRDRPGKCPRYLAHVLRRKGYATRTRVRAFLETLENPTAAILFVFGPVYGPQALRVASCESGRGVWAVNGQYLGMFQMGAFARGRYGHGTTPLAQARAAYAYFVESGRDWSPWSCKP